MNFNSILLAFQEFNTETATFSFLAPADIFNNFIEVIDDLFNDIEMQTATINSFKIYFCSLIIGTPLNLIFAYLMYKKIHTLAKIITGLKSRRLSNSAASITH